MLPFKEIKNNNLSIRTFSNSVNEAELKWHWDAENRVVICEHETDWQLQMDNNLPTKIEKNKKYFIPEGEYHRIIKGTGDLIVKVYKQIKEDWGDDNGYHAISGHFPDQEDKHNFELIYNDSGYDMGIVKNKETEEVYLVDYNFIGKEYYTDFYYQVREYDDDGYSGYGYEAADDLNLETEGIELFVKHAVVENTATEDVVMFEEKVGVIKITQLNQGTLLKKYKEFFIDFLESQNETEK